MSGVEDVADAIRAYLERCRDALNDEVRRYPTPIARCDEQLTALLDARAEVMSLLRQDGPALVAAFCASSRLDDSEARSLRRAASDARTLGEVRRIGEAAEQHAR